MPNLPTLADQRAAHLDVGDGEHENTYGLTMAEAILVVISQTNSALKVDRMTVRRVHRKKASPAGRED